MKINFLIPALPELQQEYLIQKSQERWNVDGTMICSIK
jgi:hypothetical protein